MVHLPARFRTLSMALACAAALAACGGGGGGSDDADTASGASAGSDISAANYAGFASPLGHTVVGVSDSASISSLFGGGAQAAAAHGAVSVLLAGRSAALSAGHARPQAVSSTTVACQLGGSMTISVNDADNNNQLNAGDAITTTLNACRLGTVDGAGTGSFTMTIDSLTLNSSGYPSALSVHGSFNALTAGAESMNGAFRLSAGYSGGNVDVNMSLSNMTGTVNGQSVVYNTSLRAHYDASGNGNFSINGRLGIGGETYLLQQERAFVVEGDAPVSGRLRMSDAAGDALVVKAQAGGTVDFEFYPAGASTPSATLADQDWSQYGG